MLAIIIVITLILLLATYAGFSGAPWVPVRKTDIETLLDHLSDTKYKSIIELGCGDGRFIKAASKHGYYCVGYEINPTLWLIAKLRSLFTKNMKVKYGNMWNADISQADVVMTFLVPKTMPKLETKSNEMKKSSTLASYIFKLPNKKSSQSIGNWNLYKSS